MVLRVNSMFIYVVVVVYIRGGGILYSLGIIMPYLPITVTTVDRIPIWPQGQAENIDSVSLDSSV